MIRSRSPVLMAGLIIACGLAVSAQNAVIAPEDDGAGQKTAAVKEAPAAAPAAAAAKEVRPVSPAVEEKVVVIIDAVPQAVAPVSVMGAEWGFFKDRREERDEDVIALLLPQLTDFIARYPDSEYAAEAQLLKAGFHLKTGDYKSAIVDLLRHVQEYPQAASSAAAKKLLSETAGDKTDKNTSALLAEMSKGAESADKAVKLAALLRKLSAKTGEMFYEPVVIEYREFFNRFPGYPENDELFLTLADLHSKKGEYLSAKLAYQKMIQVYPASPFLARAKRSLGAVLAERLKEYDDAIKVYKDITVSFPGTGEAWMSYHKLPKLLERQKQYDTAVVTYEEIISLYPDKEEAYDAFTAEAYVLREEMDKPAEAVAVLNRLADKYKGEKALEALFLAAERARKDIKDPRDRN